MDSWSPVPTVQAYLIFLYFQLHVMDSGLKFYGEMLLTISFNSMLWIQQVLLNV